MTMQTNEPLLFLNWKPGQPLPPRPAVAVRPRQITDLKELERIKAARAKVRHIRYVR